MKEKETVAREDIALVIPVCDPDAEHFPPLVRRLRKDFTHVVVVDDGSVQGRAAFDAVRGDVDAVLVHEVNRGKGAALRTAFAWVRENLPRAAGVVTDVAGAKLGVGKTSKGWTLECAIPWSALGGFRPHAGGRIALEPHVNDADTSHERWKLDPLDGNVRPENPTVWSIMEFTE
jgi:glycosyltransferase involved in cell wall biosynthesis